MNTAFRCMIVALILVCIYFYSTITLGTIVFFFTGTIMYIRALLIDIKLLFNRIEKLLKSKEKDTDLAILDYCKEAIDLHERVYRQFFVSV